MASIFFTCLQCGEYLKASHQSVASEVSAHMCQHEFNVVQFKKGIALLQEDEKLKSIPPPPPPPPPPSTPSTAPKKAGTFSPRGKGKKSFIFINFISQSYLKSIFSYSE